jgi:photosystem II stability/assembly factor-like uncharacterized protein
MGIGEATVEKHRWRLAAVVLSATALFACPAFAGSSTWTFINGGGRPIMAFAIAPDQSGVIYTAADYSYRALFHRSDDWGRTWTRIAPELNCSSGYYSMVVDPRDHDVVYLYAHDCGFIKSTDGGSSWTEPHFGFYGMLRLDPWRPDHLVLYENGGAYLSRDGGTTWDDTPLFAGSVAELVFDPHDQNRVYMANGQGIWESVDHGKTWKSVSLSLGAKNDGFQGVFPHPVKKDVLYAWTRATLYKTTNGGLLWQEQNTSDMKNMDPAFLTHSPDGSRFYAITTMTGQLYTSEDEGGTWVSLSLNLPTEASASGVGFQGGNSEALWVPTRKGLFTKAVGTGLWESRNRGFGLLSEVLAVSQADPLRLYSRSSGDFYCSADGGLTWYPVRLNNIVASVVTHPADPLRAWLSTGILGAESIGIYETTDGGISWAQVDSGGLPFSFTRMIGDRRDSRVLYLATESALLKSTDEGRSWARIHAECDNAILVQDASENPVLYVGGGYSPLYRSTDGGHTWEQPLTPENRPSSLAVDTRRPHIHYAKVGGWVKRSNDSGKTWEIIGILPSDASSILVDPRCDDVLYTAGGSVCVSRDGGRTWSPFEPEIPTLSNLVHLLVTPEGRMYAGSSNNVWHIDASTHLDLFFSQIGDGEAPTEGRLRTTLQLMNQGADAEAVVEFFDSLGQPLSLALGSRPAAAKHLIPLRRGQSFSATTPGLGPLKVGYARVSGGPGIAGAVVYSYLEKGTMLFEAGVPSSPRTHHFGILFDLSESENNGFALINNGEKPTDPSFTLLAPDGHRIDVQKLSDHLGRALNPGEHIARYVSEIFPELLPSGRCQGLIAISSEQPLCPVSIRQNDKPGLAFPEDIWTLSIFPVLRKAPTAPYLQRHHCRNFTPGFPQVVDGRDGDVQAQTVFRLARTDFQEWFGLRFFNSDGSVMNLELEGPDVYYDESIPAWLFKIGQAGSTTLTTKGTGPLKVGYAVINTGVFDLSGTAFYSLNHKGVKLFETGVPIAEPLTDFTVFFDSVPDLLRTGLAMVNFGNAEANVTFRVYDRDGECRAQHTWHNFLALHDNPDAFMPIREHKARFIDELVPAFYELGLEGGIMTVESDQPLAAVTVRQRDNPEVPFPDDVYLITVFPVVPGRHDHP